MFYPEHEKDQVSQYATGNEDIVLSAHCSPTALFGTRLLGAGIYLSLQHRGLSY